MKRLLVFMLTLAACSTTQSAPTPPVHKWSKGFASLSPSDTTAAYAVRADTHDGVIMGGSFEGDTDFGCLTLHARGGPDAYVGKFSDANGQCQWIAQLGAAGAQAVVTAVATDNDDVYAAGWYNSTITLSDGSTLTSAGGTDGFLTKYEGSTGVLLWSTSMGGSGQDKAYAMTLDTDQHPVVTGYFGGTARFGGAPITSAGSSDVFVASYSPEGSANWSKGIGGTGADLGNSIAASLDGTVAVAGKFTNTVDFGNAPVTSAGFDDAFLTMLDTHGWPLWTRVAGSTSPDIATAVATDLAGNPVFTGTFSHTLNFGGEPLVGSSIPSIFLVKYTAPTGEHVWSKKFAAPSPIFGGVSNAVAVRQNGDVALTGSITDDVDFGGGPLPALYTADIFLAEFSPDGNHKWSKRYPGGYTDSGRSLDYDAQDNLVVDGVVGQMVNFGGGPIGEGAFLAQFADAEATTVPTATVTITATETPVATATPTLPPAIDTPTIAPTATATVIIPRRCDVTRNGSVTTIDAVYIQEYVAGIRPFDAQQKLLADASKNGTVSVYDATLIQQYIAGDKSIPCNQDMP